MSMRMMQQIQKDHINLQDIRSKKEKDYDGKFSQLRKDLTELKKDIDEKFDKVLNLLINQERTESPPWVEDKPKIDTLLEEDIPPFIPDIDTSDMTVNIKEEKEHLKDVDLEEGLEALDKLIK